MLDKMLSSQISNQRLMSQWLHPSFIQTATKSDAISHFWVQTLLLFPDSSKHCASMCHVLCEVGRNGGPKMQTYRQNLTQNTVLLLDV